MGRTVIFYNGHVTTLDPAYPRAEAIVVAKGRIVAVGKREEILLQFGRTNVDKVDLMGGYVYPGLVDSHIHLSGVGQKLTWLNLEECRSKEEMLTAIRGWAEMRGEQEWILGLGWDENRMHGMIPTLAELDEVSQGRPLFLARICFHTYLVNSAAYRLAGIAAEEPDPEDGAFGRDEAGRLNGRIYENASQAFYRVLPKPTFSEKKEALKKAMRATLASGLTGVHTEDLRYIESVDELVRLYRELVEEGVYLRTHQLIYHPYLMELEESGWKAGEGDDWFRIGALKIFADGSIGGRTALLSEPYADDPGNVGLAIHEEEELGELATQAVKRGMPIAVHAIGDAAVERVLRVMADHPLKPGNPSRLRHRLIHAQFLRPDLIERLKRLEVVVDIQPRFVASDFPWVLKRVGMKRASYAYTWKTLWDAGVQVAGGSDAPIEPFHPLLGIHAAVTRRRLDDPKEHPGYGPEQKLTPIQALHLFTKGSAYAAGEERERGTLSVGKFADLTVYERDILTVEPDELDRVQTLFTVVNGRIGYRA